MTVYSKAGIDRTIARLTGYAEDAMNRGDSKAAMNYMNGVNKFVAQVRAAMEAAGISTPNRETK